MPLSVSFCPTKPKIPPTMTIYLSTPLYLLTTLVGVTAIVLLAFSSPLDDFVIFPNVALLLSVLTAPVRCTLWLLSFWVRVRWVRLRGGEEVVEGSRRLCEEGREGREERGKREEREEREDGKGWRYGKRVGEVLLSWNAWVAATLAASWAVLIWRYIVNMRGRMLSGEARCAAVLLAADCMLHAWLASSGLGDVEYMVLRNPFIKEEDGLGEEREGDHGKGEGYSGGGKRGGEENEKA